MIYWVNFDRHATIRPEAGGFTLVELVVVIVIVGILAAIAGPRFVDSTAFSERGYYEELVAAHKFAQRHAVATGCPVRLEVTAGGYAAHQQPAAGGTCNRNAGGFPVDVTLADGTALAGAAPGGVTASPATTVVFDPLGRTSLGSDTTITVGSFAFTVHAASGFVEAP